jgi:hypothetical protein
VSNARLDEMRQQWRDNRRLRLAVLAACAILGLHGVLTLADTRDALGADIARDADLLARLEQASRDQAWPDRAIAAHGLLHDAREAIPVAGSEGRARAELQSWLSRQGSAAGMADVRVRVQDVVAVEGHPDLQQVIARLDGTLPKSQLGALLDAMGAALPWIQVERLSVSEGEPAAVALVVRGYYRTPTDAAPATGVQVTPLPEDAP